MFFCAFVEYRNMNEKKMSPNIIKVHASQKQLTRRSWRQILSRFVLLSLYRPSISSFLRSFARSLSFFFLFFLVYNSMFLLCFIVAFTRHHLIHTENVLIIRYCAKSCIPYDYIRIQFGGMRLIWTFVHFYLCVSAYMYFTYTILLYKYKCKHARFFAGFLFLHLCYLIPYLRAVFLCACKCFYVCIMGGSVSFSLYPAHSLALWCFVCVYVYFIFTI